MEYFQKSELNFVAIDGTCSADPFKDFMVFFAAAYGVRGKIGIETDPPKLSYERWSMDQDVSIVSYIPVPYAESGDISDVSFENFAVDDASKINLSHIHTRLMELSEIYLAYQMASASTLSTPQIILMDRSLSGVLMSTDGYLSAVRLFGHPIGTRQLVFRDGLVASAHPFNDRLSVPTVKKFARWKFLVKELDSKNEIQIEELIQKTNIDKNKWAKTLNETYARELFEYDGFKISRKFDFAASWFDTVRFFEEFCDRLFHRREAEALLYPVLENGHERLRWMSPEDIAFLINVGIRALIEKCWEKRILLIGIVKDSATKFFSRNYIGVMRELGHYPQVPVKYLPWTDRSLLEGLAYQLDDLSAPWATVEFDSAYMSLHVEEDEKGRYIRGHRGLLVNQERLFARSLGQFYKKSSGSKTLMGHVVFLDRLLDPYFDNQFMNSDSIPTISSDVLGEIQPAFFGDNTVMNYGQATVMNLLGILTRNLFPEVIGYPDPLHKADWGAKSVKRRVDRLIQSSEITFRINPLNQKFRTLRDSARR
ncbi:DNA double-strand break repair nuclease NurA [Methanoculleus sp.]|uniref:DNA double-strand break repair nuclease NurA n=1 Tax=Methanoculleus sp. TaxID=90427 RepID=UPI0025D21AB9|nr:DNA double-strand break repair nuclease NurA [Methanoculleus sp.]